MKQSIKFKFLTMGVGTLLFFNVAAAWAHHAVKAKFDETRKVNFSGIVTTVDWANPHAHIFLNVPDEDGNFVKWAVEIESPVELEWSGWKPEELRSGDTITVEGISSRDGSKQIWGNRIVLKGKPIFTVAESVFDTILGNRPDGQTPRWPDGQPRISGYWAAPSSTALLEDGVQVEMDKAGILNDISDAGKVAPFQTWAKDLYVLRQSNFLKDDPMFLYCIPPGGPRQFQNQLGVQFAEQRERNRIFVLLAGGNRNWRLIYTDAREQVGNVEGDDNNPLFYGRSVAHWEGDTLVVDSRGFNETFWFSNGGLPHTSQLHLIERFTRTDINTLKYEVTIDDPGAYTRPWTSSSTLQWVPHTELPEYFCQDNRP